MFCDLQELLFCLSVIGFMKRDCVKTPRAFTMLAKILVE